MCCLNPKKENGHQQKDHLFSTFRPFSGWKIQVLYPPYAWVVSWLVHLPPPQISGLLGAYSPLVFLLYKALLNPYSCGGKEGRDCITTISTRRCSYLQYWTHLSAFVAPKLSLTWKTRRQNNKTWDSPHTCRRK